MEEMYKDDINNPNSDMSKYLWACYNTYNNYILDNYNDNHLGGMVLASTLWRIRAKISQKTTDRIVAQTILDLNQYLKMRGDFYIGDKNKINTGIDWPEILFGLIDKDLKNHKGNNTKIIIDEFSETGYPVQNISY